MRTSKDLENPLKLGGFRLTKFVNVPATEEILNPSIAVTAIIHNFASSKDHLNFHVLGLKWHQGCDSLDAGRGFNRELQTSVSQRTVYCFVSVVFDLLD